MSKFAETEKILPLLAVQDIAATATGSAYIDVNMAAGTLEFEVPFGLITDSDSTSGVTVTLEASTAGASSDTQTQLAFKYRLSAAVATDTMGDLTAATAAAGATVNGTTEASSILLIYVNPADVAAAVADGRFVRVYLTPDANVNATLTGVIARYTPRYAGASIPSST
jgi:hypothetical protein